MREEGIMKIEVVFNAIIEYVNFEATYRDRKLCFKILNPAGTLLLLIAQN